MINKNVLRPLTGILLIVTPLAFMATFTLLQINFEYPDILRKPAGYVLEQFSAGGAGLLATWYAFAFTAILFIPAAVLLHPLLAREDAPYMRLATVFGITAGIVQFLGLIRWPFLVPYLARTYLDPASSEATRDAVVVVFQAFNQYAGVAVGEHLGYLFTSGWTLLVGLAMLKSPIFKSWLGWLGIASAAGIVMGMLEPAGVPLAGAVNAISYIVWALWLVLVGIFVLKQKGVDSLTAFAAPGAPLAGLKIGLKEGENGTQS